MLKKLFSSYIPLALAVALTAFCFYIMFGSIDWTRSFWYDEVHVAWVLSKSSLWDVFKATFSEGLGRPSGYMFLSKIFSLISNTELSYRLVQIIGILGAFLAVYRFGVKEKSFLYTLFLIVIVFVSDNFFYHAVEFKPYVFDVMAGLIYLNLFFSIDINKVTLPELLKYILLSSILSLFTTIGWTGTVAIPFAWGLHRLRDKSFPSLKVEVLNLFKRPTLYSLIGCASIWLYNVQRVGRSFIGGDGERFYGHVVDHGVQEAGAFQIFSDYIIETWEIIATFGTLDVSTDMPFFLLSDHRTAILGGTVGALGILGIVLGRRSYLKTFLVSFLLIGIVLSILVDWPYDSERWSLGLITIFAGLALLGLERIMKLHNGLGFLVLLPLILVQVPFKSHPNGLNFASPQYWTARGLPTTDSRELLQYVAQNDDYNFDNLVVTRNVNVFIDYYSRFHDGNVDMSKLRDAYLTIIHPSQNYLEKVVEDIGSSENFATFDFHGLRHLAKAEKTLEQICPVGEKINGTLGHRRLYRAAYVQFNCKGKSLEEVSSERLVYFQETSPNCPLDQVVVSGTEASRFEEEVTLGSLLTFEIAGGKNGIASDHGNIVNPVLKVDDDVYDVSRFQIFLNESNKARPSNFDRTFAGNPLLLNNTIWNNGMGMHADAKIGYVIPKNLRGKTAQLSFLYGLDSRVAERGNFDFSLCLYP